MQHTSIVGPVATWSRDFALIGAVTGSLAPYLVIFDPVFAVAGGLAGAGLGAMVGAGGAHTVEALRKKVPLSVLAAFACTVGAVWGGATGGIAGMVASMADSSFMGGGVVLGLLFGGIAGAMQLGWMFLPYLVASTHRRTLPVVVLALVTAPTLGWGSLFALATFAFGMWLFVLPLGLVGAALLEHSVGSARRLEAKRAGAVAIADGLPA